jgi:hypothetical protein
MTACIESKRVLGLPGAKFDGRPGPKTVKRANGHFELPALRAKGACSLGVDRLESSRAAELREGRGVPLEAIRVLWLEVPGDPLSVVIRSGSCKGHRLTIVNQGEAIDKTVAKL